MEASFINKKYILQSVESYPCDHTPTSPCLAARVLTVYLQHCLYRARLVIPYVDKKWRHSRGKTSGAKNDIT